MTSPLQEPVATDVLALLMRATSQKSLPLLTQALSATPKTPQVLFEALDLSIRSGAQELASYLLESEHAPASDLHHGAVSRHVSVELLELLVKHGYDFDRDGRKDTVDRGMNLIDYPDVMKKDDVVLWLVDRGARLDRGEENYNFIAMPAPLLETAAVYASLPIFKHLQSHGAKLGRRTLHVAVGFAAAIKTDPYAPLTSPGYDPSRKFWQDRKRMVQMLPYLVDDMGLDVNARDIDLEIIPAGHYGTPLGYAAQERGTRMVKWLLEKGADPMIGGEEYLDASLWATGEGGEDIQKLLKEWQKSKKS